MKSRFSGTGQGWMMRRLSFVAIGFGLAVASHAESAPLTSLSDVAASKAIIGKWVSSDQRPTGRPDTICATDDTDWFLAAGRYQGLYEEGAWSIKSGVLTISVTRSNYSSGGEGPLKKLPKPEVRKFTIETLHGRFAKVRTGKGPAWLVRCDG